MKPIPPWEDESGVRVLRFYRTDKHPDWLQNVNKKHFYPDWPRIVLLDLTAEQFKEFDQNPLTFASKYKLFDEPQILWMSPIAMPPSGKDIPHATDSSSWTVVIVHTPASMATGAACPQTTTK